jgi:hypothetical protein
MLIIQLLFVLVLLFSPVSVIQQNKIIDEEYWVIKGIFPLRFRTAFPVAKPHYRCLY